ncbi:MAG: DUF4145 domain-containing protein [Metallibacterium sp.]
MSQDSQAARINSCIHQSLRLMEHLRSLLPNLRVDEVNTLDLEHKHLAGALASLLWQAMDEVETAFKRAALDGAAVAASSTGVEKYREQVQSHTSEFDSILFALADIEPNSTALPPEERNTPVLDILLSGFDFWSLDVNGGGDQFSNEDLKRAGRLLSSSFFEPDRWLSNSEILQPIVGDKADIRLNTPLRQRLKELYHSFKLGNHYAALALSRSILEYVLIDRAGALGFDPHGSDGKFKRLSWLIDDAAAVHPEIKAAMESVRDAGNMVMHPGGHKTNVTSLPGALKFAALESTKAVRSIVESLYLR